MNLKKGPGALGRRERQILEIVFQLGEATVGNATEETNGAPPAR